MRLHFSSSLGGDVSSRGIYIEEAVAEVCIVVYVTAKGNGWLLLLRPAPENVLVHSNTWLRVGDTSLERRCSLVFALGVCHDDKVS